jgi:hypothetical protein
VRRRLQRLWQTEIVEDGREARLLAAIAFLVTFLVTRLVTHALEDARGGGGIVVGTLHIHHLVFGLILLLVSGLLDLNQAASALRAVLFGAGSALLLDEFALVLNLADVYWAPQGRESIDAVVAFAAVLFIAVLGRGFWRAVIHEFSQVRS